MATSVPPPSSLPVNEGMGALTLLVKPCTAGADMTALAAQVHGLEVPGVRWVTKFGVEDVGYGIKELTVTAMVPPDTSTDAVMDAVRGLTNSVKSVDLVVFQKA